MPIQTQKARQPFFSFWRPVMALMIREMSTTHGRYPIGFIWMFLEPLGTILILATVFSYALRNPVLGDSFALFYATGYLPYIMFMHTQNRVSGAISFSQALLKYPRVNIFDSLMARAFLSLVTISVISFVVITVIIAVFQSSRNIDFGGIMMAYLLAFGLGVAVGSVNCFLFTRVNFWRSIWGIMNAPMFIVSGIFFTYEILPPAVQDYLWYNPLLHILGMSRASFYPNYEAYYASVVFVFGVIIVFMTLGFTLLSVLSRDYIND